MTEYHKIDSLFKRDMSAPTKPLILGDWARPEFEYLSNCEWEWTEKVDGTNIRVDVALDGGIKFGGRSDNASIPAKLVERLQAVFPPQAEALHSLFPNGAVLYGEGFGAKIQKGGGNYLPYQDFVLFDVRAGGWWLQRDAVETIAMRFGLGSVPVIGRGGLMAAVERTRAGFHSAWGNFVAEGIVARPAVELRRRDGSRIITKIKHRDFL